MNCVSEIRSNPSNFNEATLGSSLDADCRFLENPDQWGGYIEMDRLSRFCKVEICVLHIEACNMGPVNTCQAAKGIFLLYGGLHCDSVILRGFGADRVRRVAVDDMRARELAMQMTGVMRASGGYTNDRTMLMKYDVFRKMVRSEKEAKAHGRITGHSTFSQTKL
jgi:ubiquitin thioesterase OTU1